MRILTLFSRSFSPLAHPSNSVSDASGYGQEMWKVSRYFRLDACTQILLQPRVYTSATARPPRRGRRFLRICESFPKLSRLHLARIAPVLPGSARGMYAGMQELALPHAYPTLKCERTSGRCLVIPGPSAHVIMAFNAPRLMHTVDFRTHKC